MKYKKNVQKSWFFAKTAGEIIAKVAVAKEKKEWNARGDNDI